MKFIRYLLLALAVTSLFSLSAYSQKKTTSKRTKASSTKSTAAALPPLDVRAARVKVENQQVNITEFLKRLGPVAQAIEALDAEAATTKLKNCCVTEAAG